MMQVSNNVFNGDRLLFWNIIRRFPILLVNGKERAKVPSLKKVACPLFMSPFSPCFKPCLQVTRFDKYQRMT